MLFSSRKSNAFFNKIGRTLWPKKGWSRIPKYLGHRIIRMKGQTGGIAMGLAFGVGVSFTPFMGLHLVLAVALSWLFGGHMLAAAIGTMFGNPWTFPLIWALTYYTGAWILGYEFIHFNTDLTIHFFKQNFWQFFWPMMIGSLPYAFVSWIVTYFISRNVIFRYRRHIKIKKYKRKRGLRVNIRI